MAKNDQLEIIYPDGTINFFPLNPEKGITTIGSHPDNDVVVISPSMGSFHAVVDHQRKPYRIVFLNEESNAQTQGQAMSGNSFQAWADWQTIDLDGFTFTLLENIDGWTGKVSADGAPVGAAPVTAVPLPGRSAPAGSVDRVGAVAGAAVVATAAAAVAEGDLIAPSSAEEPAPADADSYASLAFRPPDEQDETVIVEANEREWVVDVEQEATCELTVVNGGDLVAFFDIQVQGVDPEWVAILPPQIHLGKGQKGVIHISLIPPARPTSSAKVYHLAFIVSSPNYPGHVTRLGASLTVNPFYEFEVGNLDPRKQVTTWKKRVAEVTLPIQNNGNSTTIYNLAAQDDANACTFEFHLGEHENYARQAKISVASGEKRQLTIRLRANKRDLVRFSPREYQYSVTTSLAADPIARAVNGSFTSRPLFGPFSVLFAVIIALALVYFIFLPRLNSFNADPLVTSLGQPVTLAWKGSIFNDSYRLRYKYPEDTQYKDMPDEIKPGTNQLSVVPTRTFTTYNLVAGDWLSRLLPIPEVSMASHAVLAIPPYPEITTFQVDKKDVSLGEAVIVKFAVKNATKGVLTVEDVPIALAGEELSGEKTFKLNKNTMVVLQVSNDSGTVVMSEYIHVWDPKDIQYDFKVDPPTVTSGNPVTVSWKVKGQGFKIDSVLVSPFAEPLPSEYKLTYYPTESMYFVLKVKVQAYEKSFPPEYVTVLPADAKPVINYFKATPPKLANGGNVEFSWSVSGPTDSIVISNKAGPVKASLPAEGYETIPVTSTATYILTAKKGSQSAAAVVDVQVESLLDVNIAITSILPSSGILRNDKVYIYYAVTPKIVSPTAPEISGSVVITDGFDNCKVELPIASCEFVFHRSGTDKKLVATYSGDANYRRTTSGPFPSSGTFSVIGSTIKISNITYLYVPVTATATGAQLNPASVDATYPYVGQTGVLQFDLVPSNSSATPVQGSYDVFVDGTTPVCVGQKLVVAISGANQVGRGICKFTFDSAGNRTFKVRYQGNEIYEAFESDPTADTSQSALKITVGAAPTIINMLTQVPAKSAQVGQLVTLGLQVMVNAPGGTPVPGKGKVKVTDINNTVYCNKDISLTGTVVCDFIPTQFSSKMIFQFISSSLNYESYTTACGTTCTGTEITYKIQPATASVKVGSIQLSPPIGTQLNPMVGQTINMNYLVLADGTGTVVKSGVLKVFQKDAANATPVLICDINLATSPSTCGVLAQHGGVNVLTTSFTDVAQNYIQNEVATANFTVDPASILIQDIIPSPAQAVEGTVVSVAFNLVPTFSTALKPTGAYTVSTNVAGETCSGTIPTTAFCTFTLGGSTVTTRTISVSFGDGQDYVPTVVKVDAYKVIHKTITTVTGNSGSPLVNGSTDIQYTVVPDFTFSGASPVTGTVRVHIYLNNVEYAGCTSTVAAGACTLTILKPGDNIVRAEYIPEVNGDYGYSASADYALKVFKVVTTFSLVNPVLSSNIGDAITYTVRATRAGFPSDIAPPTGTAIISARRISDNALALCQNVVVLQQTIFDYSEGSCTMSINSAGTWDLNVEYSGDAFYATISPPLSLNTLHVVSKYPTSVVINSANRKNNTNLFDFTFAVTKGLPTFATGITGSVTLTVKNSTLTCSAVISFNSATNSWDGTCPISLPGTGTYQIDAVYNGDANYLPSSTNTPTTVTIP